MKPAEQHLKDHWGKVTDLPMDESVRQHLQYAIDAINAARKEAIEEAAKSAMVTSESLGIKKGNELFLHEVDKQSILKLIDELK